MNVSFPVSVLPPSFEQHHDGFGVQCSRPRISWRFSCVDDTIRNWSQTRYEIEISPEAGAPGESFSVESADSVLVPWPGQESLASRARRFVRVRCHGRYHSLSDQTETTSWTDWSPQSSLEIALLENSEWAAQMVTVQGDFPLSHEGSARPLCFGKTFEIPKGLGSIYKARLYVTSHGVYTARLNGSPVGDQCLTPGFQSYHKRLHYQIFDVQPLLEPRGSNNIDIEVAPGWFASSWTWNRQPFLYGRKLGVLAQLEIWTSQSLTPLIISTDTSWTAVRTTTISSEIYDGEIYDMTTRPSLVDSPTSYLTDISPTVVSRLVSPDAPPVRVTQELAPLKMFKSRSGRSVIIDFGQNFAGRISIRNLRKPAGTSIAFRHAEAVQDGEIYTVPLRSAKATDLLTCDGSEIHEWHPRYTFHGFRYVEITGWGLEDGECPLTEANIVGEVLHSDMSRTGWFSCSNEEVDRLHENSLWGLKSNFLSIPMECPSRDERVGWTGDLNIFAPTANFIYDTAGMLSNWLDDLYLDQMEQSKYWLQGVVPMFSPNCMLRQTDDGHAWDPMPNAVWGDAAVMVPWGLYRTSGDIGFLSRQYDSMVQFLNQGVVRSDDGLWDPEIWQFGDWLDPRAPQNDSGRGTTDGTYVADCFLIHSTRIVSDVSVLLEKFDDWGRYKAAAAELLQAWRRKYVTPGGILAPDTATAMALALYLDLLPPQTTEDSTRILVASRLSRLIRLNDFKITSGFVGTAYLSRALTRANEADVAYAMLFQRQFPSYLYPVTMGATTTWERWDSMLPDGTVNPGSMTSFNHHALGSIAHWLHADVGGLEPIEPGWEVFRVRPRPTKHLAWVKTAFESRYGRIELKWTLEGQRFRLDVQVPPNSSAIVHLPDHNEASRREGVQEDCQKVGSGYHSFECQFVQIKEPPEALLPPWGRAEF